MDKEFARNYYEGIPRRYRADFLKYLVSQLGHSKEYWRSHITGCFELQLPVVIEEAFSRIIHEQSWCPPDETTKKRLAWLEQRELARLYGASRARVMWERMELECAAGNAMPDTEASEREKEEAPVTV